MGLEIQAGYNDGLPIAEVGGWAETKYRLVALYDSLFSTGMKHKWDQRVYVDLYAGPGYSRVRGTERILLGSPMLSLWPLPIRSTSTLFCEENEESLNALRQRVAREAPSANVALIAGDCNTQIERICSEIPTGSKGNTVLSLCFLDPYNLGIKFETIRKLSAGYVDFLCLLALYMDANRNYAQYASEQSHRVSDFLGTESWRQAWQKAQAQSILFPRFLAQQFAERMSTLDYIQPPFYSMKEVRSHEKNLPLYHLALFSRSEKAYDFWEQVLKYSTDQLGLF